MVFIWFSLFESWRLAARFHSLALSHSFAFSVHPLVCMRMLSFQEWRWPVTPLIFAACREKNVIITLPSHFPLTHLNGSKSIANDIQNPHFALSAEFITPTAFFVRCFLFSRVVRWFILLTIGEPVYSIHFGVLALLDYLAYHQK